MLPVTADSPSNSSKMHSRLAILMVADMVGYTLLLDKDESQTISAIRELRANYLEPVVLHHGGEVPKRMGDGWIFAFTSGDDQTRCATEVQSSLSTQKLIKLRIGAHIGEIQQNEHDFSGAGVNLAQRLQTEAPPGGMMISQELHLKLSTELRMQFRDAGSFRLMNIVQPVNGDRIAHLPDDALSISELRSLAASTFYQSNIVEGYERASQLLDRALRLNPSDAMALGIRAEAKIVLAAAHHARMDEQQLRALESDLDRAVEASPRSDYIFCMRSLFRTFQTRNVDGALADARRALSFSPAYVSCHESLGLAFLLAGKFSEASQSLQKAVSLSEADPFLPSRLLQLAISYHCQGEQQKAIETVERAIQLGARHRCFHLLRGICCRAAGNEATAMESDATVSRLEIEPLIQAGRPPLPDSLQDFADLFVPHSQAV